MKKTKKIKKKATAPKKKAKAPAKTKKKVLAKKKAAPKKKLAPKKVKAAVKVKIKAKAKVKAVVDNTPKSDEKIGIFGGAFNPIHVGHLNSAMTAKMELKLDRVIFVPSNKAPHREISGPTPSERAELIKAAISSYRPELDCSEIEIERGGVSFTVDTLEAFNKTHKSENIYFIMGADAFKDFSKWRDFEKLLKLANFVVTTRPGMDVSLFESDLPEELTKFITMTDGKMALLKTKRNIQLLNLEDVAVSSTDIRKRLRAGGDVRTLVSPPVFTMIQERGFYRRSVPAVADYRQFAFNCSNYAQDKKAVALKIYDMTGQSTYSDYSIICSATSTRHAISVAQNIIEKVKEEYGIQPVSFEGAREGLWVLIDYGPLVIHVFEDQTRSQYRIEDLWRTCRQIQNEMKSQSSN